MYGQQNYWCPGGAVTWLDRIRVLVKKRGLCQLEDEVSGNVKGLGIHKDQIRNRTKWRLTIYPNSVQQK